MARKMMRGALAVASAAALGLGTAAVAQAQTGSLSSVTGSLGGKDLGVSSNPKQLQGNIGGPAWNVDLYTQLFGNEEVAPGAEVKVRVEIVGVQGDTNIHELRQSMPLGFQLKKVETLQAGLLGIAPKTLNQGEYASVTKDGRTEARVALEEGLIFKGPVKVNTAKPLIVDFTWKAPEKEGTYNYGAGASVGAAINPSEDFPKAGTVTVTKNAQQGGTGSLGNLGGSGSLGNLGGSGVLGSLSSLGSS